MLDTTDSFDSDFSAPADWARMYRSLGLQVVPAPYPMRTRNDKRPSLAKWREFQDGLAPQAVFDKWFPDDAKPNMGVITGGDERVLVIDLDDYKGGEAAAWFSEITLGVAPETWQQTTGGGGRQVFYRLPEGVSIGNCRTANGIDIRCQAGFAMLPPSLHMSGKCYEWVAGSAPWDCELDTAPPHIIRAVQELIIEHGGAPSPSPGQRTASPGQDFNAFGQQIDGREEKMTRIVWAVVVGLRRESDIFDTATGFAQAREEAWQTYFRTVKSRLPGTDQVALLEKEGRGPSLFNAKWAKALSQWDGKVKAAAEDPKFIDSIDGVKFDPETGEVIGEEPSAAPLGKINATPFGWIDPQTIPPRAWVYNRHFIRKFISTTVAPGGVGKTALEVVELLAIATGRPLLGVMPDERCNVWLWNGEDPLEEMQRRIMAAALHHKLKPEDIAGRFYMDTGRVTPIIIAEKTRDGAVINAPVVADVIATIKANNIGVMSIDPFVSCHRVTENDNSEIERVAKTWAHIADETNCAIELVHHVRKTNGNEVSVEDGRGAVALLAAARAARALNRMTADEAAKAGVSDPGFYFRADNGKANLAPPSSTAAWFHLASFDLENKSAASAIAPARPSDKIGVVESWAWPDHTSSVTAGDMYEVRRRVGQGRYRADQQSSEWVGLAILEVVGGDIGDPAAVAKAKALQRMWTQNKVIEEYDDKDERRRVKRFVRPGPFEKESAPP